MPEQNLNPDAEIAAGEAIYDAFSGQFGDLSGNDCDNMAEVAIRAYLSALPVQPDTVDSVDYRSTPQGHYDAWQDTGDGYYQRKGWTLTCIWCGADFTGDTKSEALKGYKAHEESILQKLS